ncbi:glycoside-pentoside-hexuronide :cation symporter family [Plasmopara halstedii]|uniref:Glycoside-pentoside-hexuronide: cation symporter family n=1 Tax=Plasmopara halstedii TaxID=4781 RepID=A0A0P1APA1_PLAHL|nr:glycoside-pentoside-hexuronide :cation symporter family [Plasmopara halstedii]CEG42623.1 glycoside-pentoside-hexuronide :cation symporter family [Plasmopara halstedii]|eukprot:XP_024578992.1 glycoside-pentoside-hexuronide :cation symporter family [Plasmopara halstedii]
MADVDKGFDIESSPKHVYKEGNTENTQLSHPPIWLLLAVSMPRMAITMAWSAQWAALGPYLSTMLPRFAVQITQFIGPVVGVLVGPSAGVLSDRTTSQFGRRRPYLVVAGTLSIICWIAMSYTREMGEALGDHGSGQDDQPTDRTFTAILTVFFYLWMDITVNVVQTPAMLLVADFSGDRQTTGAALSQAWSTLGSLLVAGYIEFFGAAHKTLHEFMWMLSVTMFICITVAVIFSKETPLDASKVDAVSTCRRIGHAFASVYTGIRTLPGVLVIYGVGFFFIQYGFTAYNGNKGQFFGLEVYNGSADNADTCDPCTPEQDAYNRGVGIAGGRADLLFNVIGYLYSWTIPLIVSKIGARWFLTVSTIPQMFLMIMAWTSNVTFNVFVVATTSITQAAWFSLIVPAVVHVFGPDEDIGMYVGALNSANCFGQLLNFAVGSGLVETSLGYKLPVFLGGLMSALGFLVTMIFFKMEMYSM